MGDRRTRYAEGNCNQDVGNFLNNAPDLLMCWERMIAKGLGNERMQWDGGEMITQQQLDVVFSSVLFDGGRL